MDISVVVPVYNGEKTIGELYARIKKFLDGRFLYEVIFVYDYGSEGSREVIGKLEKEYPENVKGLYLKSNVGQHRAILEGIRIAEGEFVITMDEDLQHDPAYIPLLKEKQAEGGYDVVYAKFRKLKHPGMRVWLSELLRDILRRIIPGLCPHYSSYRLIRKEVAQRMLALNSGYVFIDGYLAKLTERFGYIEADHHRRADGQSSYSYLKLIRHAVLIAVNYSRVLFFFNRNGRFLRRDEG
ncbi:MAG TPA: glycosyltransferase [Bacteroidales bacterium]|nr:glycosyltransferase [Bacteroidales bacterium]